MHAKLSFIWILILISIQSIIRFVNTENCDQMISSDTSKNGTFTSPGYPNPFTSGVNCVYHFTGRGRERVQILFTDFDLGPTSDSDSCDSASLTVYITINGERSRIDDFCGRVLPPKLMSNGPTMTIEFSGSVQNSNARGFKAIYKFVSDFGVVGGRQDEQSVCGFFFNSTVAKTGRFTSPNHPGFYPRNTECYYFFYGRPGEKVQLTFSFFDVEGVLPCSSDTASDFLEFSNFRTVDRKLGRACGNKNPEAYKSDGDYFRVTFKSNDRLDGRGFSAIYQFMNATITDNLERQQKISTNNQDTSTPSSIPNKMNQRISTNNPDSSTPSSIPNNFENQYFRIILLFIMYKILKISLVDS